ncbi:MAG: hypothetical protein PHU47_02570 [Candidatus ainarchaeum sp.]|nr:hypothetical protein [Candidatus ainarchaeum sp.]
MDLIILSFFEDFGFILKIFFLLFIITFVRTRITHNFFALTLITIGAVFLIFFYWPIFGTAYLFYILLTIGVSGVLVDIFFVTMNHGPKDMLDKMPGKKQAEMQQQRMQQQRSQQKQGR